MPAEELVPGDVVHLRQGTIVPADMKVGDGELLVGISRTLTDFSYVGYLSDLAVRRSHQKLGIGIELIQKTREKMGSRSMLVLLSAPQAVEYYPRIGFTQHPSAWVLRAGEKFPR